MNVDPSQWQVTTKGERVWVIYCRITGNVYDVPVAKLENFFSSLDKQVILQILVDVCSCKGRPCCAQFTYQDILEVRAEAFLGSGIAHYANLLAEANDEGRRTYRTVVMSQPTLTYLIKMRRVCRIFYRSVYSLSNHACNSVRHVALGGSPKLRYTPPRLPKRISKTELCQAFWNDFFVTLAPSPVDGLLLWPGHRSRKLIYAIDFVEWYLRTQEGYTVPRQEECVSTVSTMVRRIVPIEAGGSFAIPSSSQIDVAGISHEHRRRLARQRKHSLYDVRVDSDSDDESPDVAPNLVDKLPSFSLFCRTRHHLWFKMVKNRPSHRHQLCRRCFRLSSLCQIGWRNGVNIELFQREVSLHLNEVRCWRVIEVNEQTNAKQYQTRVIVLSYDDTSALSLPRFGVREPKGLPYGTVDFVPWNITNHGLKENHYFYTLKERIPKGGNRICTFLYHYLKRLKFFDVCQRTCRKLILMGDNYVENKCNVLLCFLCHLVHWNWFDTVELLFGPVGHTHNGNDSVHHCHNNIAGDNSMISLAEFLTVFPLAWTNDEARPSPVYVEDIYDWEKYYHGHLRSVGGLTATVHSELYVRAIKMEVGPSGLVEMVYKGSPANPEWAGLDKPDDLYPTATGFVLLTSFPEGSPDVISPTLDPEKVRTVKRDLCHARIVDLARACEMENSLDWLKEVMENGTIPSGGLTRRKIVSKIDHFGSVEVVGIHPRIVDLPIIRPTKLTQTEMFKLPVETLQEEHDRRRRLQLVQHADKDACVSFVKKRKPAPPVRQVVARARTLFANEDAVENEEKYRETKRQPPSSVEEGEEDSLLSRLSKQTKWQAKMRDCQVGGFAAVHSVYDNGVGLEIWEVHIEQKTPL